MHCSKCGTELPDGASFCWKCGLSTGLDVVGRTEPPHFEVCHLVVRSSGTIYWWEAIQETERGRVVVAKSAAWEELGTGPHTLAEWLYRNVTERYAKEIALSNRQRRLLISTLAADGWEPAAANDAGTITTMKRKV